MLVYINRYNRIYIYIYSGGWRYVRLFESEFKHLKSQLEEKFPSKKIIIAGKKVRNVGTFDVEIEGVKLIHTKQGFVDSPEKLNKIVEEIELALANI